MVILTGSSGFVGSNILTYLRKDKKKVVGVSRSSSKGDVTYSSIDEKLLNTASSFIHLAGIAHDLKKTSCDDEYFEVNTSLTKSLFDTFLNSDCRVFIYMSSVKAVADFTKDKLTEDMTPDPKTIYGKSKLAAERYILSKDIPKKKKVFILRPCMIHGKNNKGNLNLLFNFISKGVPYPFGLYKNKRSFVSVDNLCFIVNQLLENKDIKSGIYNVADDTAISTIDLVRIIGDASCKEIRILNIPKFLITFFARIGDILPLPVNSEKVKKLTENYEVSNLKIKQAIQKNLPLSTQEGLKKTISSF